MCEGLTLSRFGTYSTSEAVHAGLDVEMPGPTRWRGAALLHAIKAKKVSVKAIDDRVRNVLKLVKTASKSGIPEKAKEHVLDRPQDRELLRRVGAESIVLLKNDDRVLPFSKTEKVAVIGPNSKIATICGGGSASLNPYRAVTPFDGITAQAAGEVVFSQGAYSHKMLPLLGNVLRTREGKKGFTLKVYNDPPTASTRQLVDCRQETDSYMFFVDYKHPDLEEIWYADCEGIFAPEESGLYDFGLTVQGTAKLYIDGKLVVDNTENQKRGASFLGSGTVEEIGSQDLVAGKQYNVLAQWGCSKTSSLTATDFGGGGMRIGGCRRLPPKQGIKDAVEVARSVDQVILFAGLSGEWESEGEDRETMALPPHTDELISAVLEANPNTVVVIQSGTPVAMPWVEKAKSVLHAWYGGNETGHAIADVVFGDVNPSGKLPLTMPRRLKDNPSYLNYRSEAGRVLYGEDVYVGYRYFDDAEVEPLFPFGHGLSYTTFALSLLKVEQVPGNSANSAPLTLSVSLSVTNTGSATGATTVQVYILPPKNPTPDYPTRRPPQELKSFSKVHDLAAGESRAGTIRLDLIAATSYWDEEADSWCSREGTYKVKVGLSSRDENAVEATFTLKETKFWKGLKP